MNITEDEAALYDRQIRLWGLEAQKRLRSSSILLAGLGGLGAEIAKNLILAGVKAITLLDDKKVTEKDTAQFLFHQNDMGKNRAEASKNSASALNPMVLVSTDTDSLDAKMEDFFGSFSVVCITGYSLDTCVRVNKACRNQKTKFYSCDVWGLYGYGFVDLIQHTFIEERNLGTAKNAECKVEGQDAEMKTVVCQKVFEYATLEKSLTVKSGKAGSGIDKRTSPIFLLLHVMFKFMEQNGRYPESSKDEKDLINLKQEILPELGVDVARLDDNFFANVSGEISPVCAVVGGVIAQDIIKAITGQDAPIRNYFLFDGESCCGSVEYVGK